MSEPASCDVGDIEVVTKSAEATQAVGEVIAGWLRDGDVLLLHGDLGAGKTTFTKGIASGLNVQATVSSPTFALVNEYETGLFAPVGRLYHLDLFRLTETAELATIGFADLVAPIEGVAIVEWPERAGESLPERFLLLEFSFAGADQRHIHITGVPNDGPWSARLAALRHLLRPVADGGETALQ